MQAEVNRLERLLRRWRKLAKRWLPSRLAAYRRRKYEADLAAKRTRRAVVLVKPTFEA